MKVENYSTEELIAELDGRGFRGYVMKETELPGRTTTEEYFLVEDDELDALEEELALDPRTVSVDRLEAEDIGESAWTDRELVAELDASQFHEELDDMQGRLETTLLLQLAAQAMDLRSRVEIIEADL